jgi:hypothetical protein
LETTNVRNFDHFSIYVRRCRRLRPDGYEVVLEIRPRPTSENEKTDAKPRPDSEHTQGECEALK